MIVVQDANRKQIESWLKGRDRSCQGNAEQTKGRLQRLNKYEAKWEQ